MRFQVAVLSSFLLLVGCGASEDGSEPAGKGMGGAGTTSATGATSGQGPAGAGGAGGAGGVEMCDALGSCGDFGKGCSGCAVQGTCEPEYKACFSNSDCPAFNQCMGNCPADDITCQKKCSESHPVGEQLFNAMVLCIVCTECPISCAPLKAICPK